MITLKLTEGQLKTILKALGVAERVNADIHQSIISKTVTTRHSDPFDGVYKHYHEQSTKYADLSMEINNLTQSHDSK